MHTALVIGGGTMGAGIAQLLLEAGTRVWLSEITAGAAEAAQQKVQRGLTKAGASELGSNLTSVVGLPESCPAELVIEAVPEDLELKRKVLLDVEAAVSPAAIVATNTSSLSVNSLAEALAEPGRFIGMHFFNPVPRSSLVEIVVPESTLPGTVELARSWVKLLEKEEIVVRDSPGFATSRLGIAIGMEAMRMVEEGVATAEDIDRGMELGYKFPMGPLRLSDLVGLDVRLAIAEHLASTLGERFAPPQLLRDKVAAGELGKKSGKGFYDW